MSQRGGAASLSGQRAFCLTHCFGLFRTDGETRNKYVRGQTPAKVDADGVRKRTRYFRHVLLSAAAPRIGACNV